ncbi:MAG: hypothetical protein ACXWK4_12200 [Myxococcaceae bacterium]
MPGCFFSGQRRRAPRTPPQGGAFGGACWRRVIATGTDEGQRIERAARARADREEETVE